MKARRYRDYDPFAWLYVNYWGDEFHRQVVPALERLFLNRLPEQAAILDLCCGDGRVTKQLVKRKFKVTGLDGSEEMLTYARKLLPPRTPLLLADARAFQLAEQFDGCVSVFDSLNHIMSTDELQPVFRNVYAALKPGGRFAFDLNREEAYRELWASTSTNVDGKAVSIVRGTYGESTKVAHCDITLFRLESKLWQRSDFRLSQKYHSHARVLSLLQQTGFIAKSFDAVKELGMDSHYGLGRTFYLGTKPL